MSVADDIRQLVEEQFAPVSCDIINESDKHAGHAGANETGETHFHLTIVSERFSGLPPVARHRLVMTTLKPLLDGPVHALALTTKTPAETPQS